MAQHWLQNSNVPENLAQTLCLLRTGEKSVDAKSQQNAWSLQGFMGQIRPAHGGTGCWAQILILGCGGGVLVCASICALPSCFLEPLECPKDFCHHLWLTWGSKGTMLRTGIAYGWLQQLQAWLKYVNENSIDYHDWMRKRFHTIHSLKSSFAAFRLIMMTSRPPDIWSSLQCLISRGHYSINSDTVTAHYVPYIGLIAIRHWKRSRTRPWTRLQQTNATKALETLAGWWKASASDRTARALTHKKNR